MPFTCQHNTLTFWPILLVKYCLQAPNVVVAWSLNHVDVYGRQGAKLSPTADVIPNVFDRGIFLKIKNVYNTRSAFHI